MFIRMFLMSMMVFATTAQARQGGGGCAYEDFPRDTPRYQESTRGYRGCDGGRYRRGDGYRGSRMGGRGCGGHGQWNIPVQEARRLNPIEVSPQSLERGETLYRDNCLRCHGEQGFGNGPQARQLRVLPANLHHAARHYSDGALLYIIRKGRDPMPAWEDKLSEDELWHLINYLRFQIGAHHGPRFGDYPDRGERTCEPVAQRPAAQQKAMQDAEHDLQAMDHDERDESEYRSEHDDMHEEHHEEHHDE